MELPRKDRFSNLPEDIAHHILSFLSSKDHVILTTVSKTCRDLYLTLPSLNFDATDRCLHYTILRSPIMNFFDRMLMHREGKKISNLRIRWGLRGYARDQLYRIYTWLQVAVRCNVEVIDLDILYVGERVQLPLCLFSCKSLRSLTVNLHSCTLLKPFSTVGFTYLHSLSIKYVRGLEDSFGDWISTFCKSLKELRLEHIDDIENISIKVSSLEYFVILNPTHLCHLNVSGDMLQVMRVDWIFESPIGKSLKIYAPNLKNLTWNGNPTNNNCLGDLMHLEGAQLFLEPKLHGHQNLPGVFHSISRAKDLCLHEIITKALFEQGCLPTILENIHSLSIFVSSLHDDLVPAVAFLLQRMPNLKNLSIKSSSSASNTNVSGFNIKYWVSQNLPFIDQLEVVVIELFNGENELELAKYMLKHGKELKKIFILHSPPLPSYIIRKLNKYRKRIHSGAVIFPQKK